MHRQDSQDRQHQDSQDSQDRQHRDSRVVFLEIGVGYNTPGIIKYNFWQEVYRNENAVYACLNYDEAVCPEQIKARSLCLDGDSGEVLKALQRLIH